MPEMSEFLGLVAGLIMAGLVAPLRLSPARNWLAAGFGAMTLAVLLFGALVTVSVENYFDPDHQLNSAMAQAAPAR